MVKIHKLIT